MTIINVTTILRTIIIWTSSQSKPIRRNVVKIKKYNKLSTIVSVIDANKTSAIFFLVGILRFNSLKFKIYCKKLRKNKKTINEINTYVIIPGTKGIGTTSDISYMKYSMFPDNNPTNLFRWTIKATLKESTAAARYDMDVLLMRLLNYTNCQQMYVFLIMYIIIKWPKRKIQRMKRKKIG